MSIKLLVKTVINNVIFHGKRASFGTILFFNFWFYFCSHVFAYFLKFTVHVCFEKRV